MIRFALFAVLLSAVAGCPKQTVPAGDSGMEATVDTGTGMLTMGIGGIGQFENVYDNDTLLLARGCQGGQHVWMGVRAEGIDTSPALIQMDATRVRDNALMSVPFQVRLTFDTIAGESYTELNGLQLVIPDPDAVLNEDIRILVRVTEVETGGATLEVEHTVRIEWGTEVCGGMNQPG